MGKLKRKLISRKQKTGEIRFNIIKESEYFYDSLRNKRKQKDRLGKLSFFIRLKDKHLILVICLASFREIALLGLISFRFFLFAENDNLGKHGMAK